MFGTKIKIKSEKDFVKNSKKEFDEKKSNSKKLKPLFLVNFIFCQIQINREKIRVKNSNKILVKMIRLFSKIKINVAI